MSELEEFLKEELDEYAHGIMTTCDRQGDMRKARFNGRKEGLKEIAEIVGVDYEHDKDGCERCDEIRETVRGLGHMTDEEVEESLEVHGI